MCVYVTYICRVSCVRLARPPRGTPRRRRGHQDDGRRCEARRTRAGPRTAVDVLRGRRRTSGGVGTELFVVVEQQQQFEFAKANERRRQSQQRHHGVEQCIAESRHWKQTGESERTTRVSTQLERFRAGEEQ